LGLVGWIREGPLLGLGPTAEKIYICPNTKNKDNDRIM
jgi:hypothetical protein